MKKIKTNIDGLFVIENNFLSDKRGSFFKLWNRKDFKKEKLNIDFSQDNMSVSKKNVIRGLHFQNAPFGQTKYVNVLNGKVLDVAVDIRKQSTTFGQHFTIELSNTNHYALLIPAGFAHGFLSLEENTIFSYKCYGDYNPKYEHTIKWNDPDIKIDWGIKNPIISEKDKNGISFQEYLKSTKINA